MASLADGAVIIGPKPQVKSLIPELTGERNNDSLKSPTPFVLLSIRGLGWVITGMIVREMTFHCACKLIGTTGSMLRTFRLHPNGPLLKLLLFWNGTVTSDAMGFCDALARSSLVGLTGARLLLRAPNRLSHPGYGLRHPNCRFRIYSSCPF